MSAIQIVPDISVRDFSFSSTRLLFEIPPPLLWPWHAARRMQRKTRETPEVRPHIGQSSPRRLHGRPAAARGADSSGHLCPCLILVGPVRQRLELFPTPRFGFFRDSSNPVQIIVGGPLRRHFFPMLLAVAALSPCDCFRQPCLREALGVRISAIWLVGAGSPQ